MMDRADSLSEILQNLRVRLHDRPGSVLWPDNNTCRTGELSCTFETFYSELLVRTWSVRVSSQVVLTSGLLSVSAELMVTFPFEVVVRSATLTDM